MTACTVGAGTEFFQADLGVVPVVKASVALLDVLCGLFSYLEKVLEADLVGESLVCCYRVNEMDDKRGERFTRCDGVIVGPHHLGSRFEYTMVLLN